MIVKRTMHKEFHRVTTVEETSNPAVARNVLILRNYNDGRHGGWDNYCCYKGQGKGTFVNKSKTTVEKTEAVKNSL